MPRFAANLSMLYNEHEFLDRFAAAAKDGFTAVEYLFPYAFDAKVLRQCLDDHCLQQVLFNAPPGDWDAGERGLACLPGRENEFQTGFLKALDYANTLDCPRIHVMAGLIPNGADHETLEKTYIQNIAWAATQAQKTGRDVLIEPINTRDILELPRTSAQHRSAHWCVECESTNGPVPLPNHGGRLGHQDSPVPANRTRRSFPNRRCANAPRARLGGTQPPLPLCCD